MMGTLEKDVARLQSARRAEAQEARARLEAAIRIGHLRALASELEELVAEAPRFAGTAAWLDLLQLADASLREAVDLAAEAARCGEPAGH